MTTEGPHYGDLDDLDSLLGLTRPKPKQATGEIESRVTPSPSVRPVGSSPPAPSLEAALKAIESRAVATPREPESQVDRAPEQLLIRFEAAGMAFAVPMRQVLEISDRLPMTRMPGLPAHFPGIANFRGEMVLVFDLPDFLTGRKGQSADRLLLLHREGQTIGGVAMERILGIAPYDPASFRQADPQLRHRLTEHELGSVEFAGKSYSVLDLIGLLESPLLGLPQGGVA